MIIGNFYYDIGTDTYSGEIRTLTVQRRGLALRPLAKRHEREPDYRVIEMTEAGLVELGAAWRKRTERGRDYLSVHAGRSDLRAAAQRGAVPCRGRPDGDIGMVAAESTFGRDDASTAAEALEPASRRKAHQSSGKPWMRPPISRDKFRYK